MSDAYPRQYDEIKDNCGTPLSSTMMLPSGRRSATRNSKKDRFTANDNLWGLSLLIFVSTKIMLHYELKLNAVSVSYPIPITVMNIAFNIGDEELIFSICQ